MEISNSKFLNNESTGSYGGAIYAPAANLIVDNSIFASNRASSYAGAIYHSGTNYPLSITNSLFVDNKSKNNYGGAIYEAGEINLIDNSKFIGNSSYDSGSAIYSPIIHEIKNSVFDNNYSLGGASVYANVIESIDNVTFAGNNGSVIYASNFLYSLKNSTFEHNNSYLPSSILSISTSGVVDLIDNVLINIDFHDNAICIAEYFIAFILYKIRERLHNRSF